MRVVEDLGGARESAAFERAENAFVFGNEKDAADVEQHCGRIGHRSVRLQRIDLPLVGDALQLVLAPAHESQI